MAATRSTLAAAALRRELYQYRCSTCLVVHTRDGRRGARNALHACSAQCFNKARQFMIAEGGLSTGGPMTTYWRHGPIRRGTLA